MKIAKDLFALGVELARISGEAPKPLPKVNPDALPEVAQPVEDDGYNVKHFYLKDE